MFSIDGLVSGLDTSTIIEGLLEIQQNQLDVFQSRRQDVELQQTAFEGIQPNVDALRSAAQQLGSFTNNVFSVFQATSSNEDIVQAAADEDAIAGTFRFTVSQLATVAQAGSQSFESSGESIGEGSLRIQVGSRTAVDIQVDGTNNTLDGLAEAINSSTDDVTAAVINDGQGFRLLLTSQFTGAENQIQITDTSDGAPLAVDFSGPAIQEAQDAQVILGSGPGAISISRGENTIEDVVPGLTLNLLDADPDTEISISVNRDVEPAREAVDAFVNSFNASVEYIADQTDFNAETDQGGLLLGNSATNNILRDLQETLSRTIANVESNANRLSTVGITFDDNGQLQIDSGTLDRALAGNEEGISVADVRRLFAFDGQSSVQGISFVSATTDTSSPDDPVEVVVTQAAERAAISGGSDIGSSITIDSSNSGFSIEVDGLNSGELSIAEGTYTQSELANQLQTVINQSDSLSGRQVNVSVNDNRAVIESVVFGTRSDIGDFQGNLATALGFDGTETDRGSDVAGFFRVNGETELATGNGQILSGITGNENTDGLQLLVSLGEAQVGTSLTSEITLTRGFASNIELLVNDLLDTDTGRFTQAVESFEDQVASIEASVERLNAVFEARQQQLIDEFVAIESNINSLQTTSSILASQLGSAQLLGN